MYNEKAEFIINNFKCFECESHLMYVDTSIVTISKFQCKCYASYMLDKLNFGINFYTSIKNNSKTFYITFIENNIFVNRHSNIIKNIEDLFLPKEILLNKILKRINIE